MGGSLENSERAIPLQHWHIDKTEGMWLGKGRNNVDKPFGIRWSDEPIKALGIYFRMIKGSRGKNLFKT